MYTHLLEPFLGESDFKPLHKVTTIHIIIILYQHNIFAALRSERPFIGSWAVNVLNDCDNILTADSIPLLRCNNSRAHHYFIIILLFTGTLMNVL